jgi:anaphase-promoting complex subunit 2
VSSADIVSNVKRLLHPGAETKDVITQYISTIRCLRILDPPGVLLHKVAEPIRRHLRERHDTIKCIVSALVEGEELQDENEGRGGIIPQDNDTSAENFSDPRWEPEPMDAAPGALRYDDANIRIPVRQSERHC